MATQFEKGFDAALEMFDLRLQDDEIMHNIWWAIKREDNFPSQDFIADIIFEFLIKGKNSDVQAYSDLSKPIYLDAMDHQQLMQALDGENK